MLAVATRPGFPVEGDVEQLEIQPVPVASRELRALVAEGESIDAFVPPAVADLIRARGLYVGSHGYTESS